VVRDNLLPVLDEAEQAIDNYEGHSADLLRDFILGWWQRIGDTPLSGLTKLMMAESGNFPELVRFYEDEVVARGNALLVRVLERGLARGEFRPHDPQVMMPVLSAPVLMLMMWNNAFLPCGGGSSIDPDQYMAAFLDLALRGLAPDADAALPRK
jgi:hypothetical protein